MDLVQRAKNILVAPAAEWRVIEPESTSAGDLIAGYALPFLVVDAVARFIGSSVIGSVLVIFGSPVVFPVMVAFVAACVGIVTSVIGLFVLSFVINALAPTFGGRQSNIDALKLTVYASTGAWVAGIAAVIPGLGALIAFLGALYSLYLFYLGLPVLMKNPADKSIIFMIVVAVVWVVMVVVFGIVTSMVVGAGMLGARFMF